MEKAEIFYSVKKNSSFIINIQLTVWINIQLANHDLCNIHSYTWF